MPRAAMAGNSLKSDVIPVLQAGGWGIHVPQGPNWDLERAEPPTGHPRFRALADLSGMAAFLGWRGQHLAPARAAPPRLANGGNPPWLRPQSS